MNSNLKNRQPSVARAARRHLQDIEFCAYCGRQGTSKDPDGRSWHMEHVRPLAVGGDDKLSNIVKACADCNARKGTKYWLPLPGVITAAGVAVFEGNEAAAHMSQLRIENLTLEAKVFELKEQLRKAKDLADQHRNNYYQFRDAFKALTDFTDGILFPELRNNG